MKLEPTLSNIYRNPNRRKIIQLIQEENGKLTATDIKERLKLDYRVVWKNLEFLKKAGLIRFSELKNKKGKPKKVTFNEGKLKELEMEERKRAAQYFESSFPKDMQIDLLKLLKSKEPISQFKFNEELVKAGFPDTFPFLITKLTANGTIETMYKLTEKGKKAIK